MILTCPQCATRYQTDAAKFPAEGRKVRCAKCSHVWHQDAPAPEPEAGIELAQPETTVAAESVTPSVAAPEAPAATESFKSEPVRAEPAAPVAAPAPTAQRTAYAPSPVVAPPPAPKVRARSGERIAVVFGWFAFALIVVAIGWSTIRFREAIAGAWPQSASLYAAIGMKVNASGIDITDVQSQHTMQGGQPVLAVEGKLVNLTARDVAVPQMSVRLTDDDQHELDRWTFSANTTVLKPRQSIAFSTRRTNPPEDARHLEVSFVEAGG